MGSGSAAALGSLCDVYSGTLVMPSPSSGTSRSALRSSSVWCGKACLGLARTSAGTSGIGVAMKSEYTMQLFMWQRDTTWGWHTTSRIVLRCLVP